MTVNNMQYMTVWWKFALSELLLDKIEIAHSKDTRKKQKKSNKALIKSRLLLKHNKRHIEERTYRRGPSLCNARSVRILKGCFQDIEEENVCKSFAVGHCQCTFGASSTGF